MLKSTKKAFAAMTSVVMGLSLLSGCNGGTSSEMTSDTVSGNDVSTGEAGGAPAVETIDTGWTYGQVAVGGGGFVTGVFSTCEENVYYARTDVGGGYRWDEGEQMWKSLNYWVSEADVGLMGISALAVDPNNAAKVYMLAGTEYFSGGKTCVLKSDDYGKNFTVVDVTSLIKVHGNGMGRGNGERLAIDPNNTDILFAGGTTGGMIKSSDGGLTWDPVYSFPVSNTSNKNGINIIVFDKSSVKDGVTQRIFAAVSETGENIYVSEDAGETWNPVSTGCDMMPQRIKPDENGNLFIVYGDKEGPWNQSKGALYKYNIADKTAENIAPGATPYGDIVIDPNDSNKMVLCTTQTWLQQPNGSYGDTFFVTTDGGKNWTDVLSTMKMSNNDVPWITDCAIHWCSSMSINPFDADEIMVTSGNGIFACDNIFDAEPEFYFNSRGIEETVPMDMITMKDYPLVSAALDYDGFRHEDINVSADRHSDKIGSTTSITVAPQNRDCWAKTGGSDSGMALSVSSDGGKTWKAAKSPEKGKTYHTGTVAFNADGSVLIWSPSNSHFPFYSEDMGKNWTKCEGIMAQNAYIIGDPSNADYVYAYGNDKLYASSDGGKTFEKIGKELFLSERRLAVDPDNEGVFYIPAGAGLYKATDHGAVIERIDGVKFCQCVSLGKPKNEGDPYVIYIYGTANDASENGIFMSEDDGATWTQVNDAAHRFGGTGNGGWICGDMNVYGRCYMSTVGLGIVYCDKTEK